MNKFQKKYGYQEDESVKSYHVLRRMWCVKDGVLFIAEPDVEYSHAQWFANLGWPDTDMDELTRGIVDPQGDLYFYVGYEFKWTEQAEKDFFNILPELVEKLALKQNAAVYGGIIKGMPGAQWPADKKYGTIQQVISQGVDKAA